MTQKYDKEFKLSAVKLDDKSAKVKKKQKPKTSTCPGNCVERRAYMLLKNEQHHALTQASINEE